MPRVAGANQMACAELVDPRPQLPRCKACQAKLLGKLFKVEAARIDEWLDGREIAGLSCKECHQVLVKLVKEE